MTSSDPEDPTGTQRDVSGDQPVQAPEKDALFDSEADTVDWWLTFFRRCPPGPGGGDMFCAGRDYELRRAASFVATAIALRGEDGPFFAHVSVVIPPDHATPSSVVHGLLMERVSSEFQARGQSFDRAVLPRLSERIRVQQPETLRLETLLVELKKLPPNTAVLIADMARYRSSDARPG